MHLCCAAFIHQYDHQARTCSLHKQKLKVELLPRTLNASMKVFWKSLCSCTIVGHRSALYTIWPIVTQAFTPHAWFLGRDLDSVPLMGGVFHWLKPSPTASFGVQRRASSSEEEGKQLLLWCALQTPPTIRIMFSSSCFDTLLMAIICCPHKYDGLLKDPQDAA